MFESLKHWLETLAEQNQSFKDADATSRTALASVLFHVIKADTRESGREKTKFEQILAGEFGIGPAEAAELYRKVHTFQSDLQTDLATLEAHLKDDPNVRLALMRQLNQLVALDGVDTRELEVFNAALARMFPELVERDAGL